MNTAYCPNCGIIWPEGAGICPHCGYVRPGLSAWPPPPTGFVAPSPPPAPTLLTGAAWGDLTLGIGVAITSFFFYCLGFVIMPILWLIFQRKYPIFSRGIGYGLLAGITVLLGAFAYCMYGTSRGGGI